MKRYMAMYEAVKYGQITEDNFYVSVCQQNGLDPDTQFFGK